MSFPTQDEIVTRIRAVRDRDMFGFEVSEYLDWLDFEHAKEFLKDTATAGKWAEGGRPFKPMPELVIAAIKDYMPFAWDKANNCRGLSAGRSITHMRAWLWLLGEHEAADRIMDYDLYGKPQLRAICEKYGIDWQSLDDGEWRNDEFGRAMDPQSAAALFEKVMK